MNEDRPLDLEATVLDAVRDGNRQGRAVARAEVFAALAAREVPDPEGDLCARAAAALDAHPELASFAGLDGEPLYHDPGLLSGTFARIVDRKAAPARLMAEEIRLNSRDYPRPLPVELFEAPPFALDLEQISLALQTMAADPQCADIACAVTASGAVYLFSTRHLDPGHAQFLADRAETMALNP